MLELILQEELAAAFPLDTVAEVKKGARGADARHSVMTRTGQTAGTILWEAKRAQKWGAQWPAKLREDMREAGAEVGVIVTTCFPADWPESQPFGLYEDVWVTGHVSAVALATALRAGLLDAYKARVVAANKGENMEAVYDYLTSPQFAHKLRAVYDAFRRMRDELNSERTTMQQRWKRREKQIHLATTQLVAIAGDLQGLAQQDLPQLELEPPGTRARRRDGRGGGRRSRVRARRTRGSSGRARSGRRIGGNVSGCSHRWLVRGISLLAAEHAPAPQVQVIEPDVEHRHDQQRDRPTRRRGRR